MVLQANGEISLNDIAGEFGGTSPDGIEEYYRNGGLVTNNNLSVPTCSTGDCPINFENFYNGELAYTVYLLTAQQNLVLSELFSEQEWASVSRKEVVIVSVPVYSIDTTIPACRTGILNNLQPMGGTLTLINGGYIYGAGGLQGLVGGDCIEAEIPVIIENYGRIWSGGGGGGFSGIGGDRFIKNYYNGTNYKNDANNYYVGYSSGSINYNFGVWFIDGVLRLPQLSDASGSCAHGWIGDITAIQTRSSSIYDSRRTGAKYFYEHEGGQTFYNLQRVGVRGYTVTQDVTIPDLGGIGQGYNQTRTFGEIGITLRQINTFRIMSDRTDFTNPFTNTADLTNCEKTTDGDSGDGGDWGENGIAGTSGTNGVHYNGIAGGSAGLGGFYIVGNINVTWVEIGSVKGRVG